MQEKRQFIMPFAKITEAYAKNLMNIDKIKVENIIAFSASASSKKGKTTFFNSMMQLAGVKIKEKPLKIGAESGEIGGKLTTIEGDSWNIVYKFDKNLNIPVLSSKELTKNGKKTTKKAFDAMVKQIKPVKRFSVVDMLSLSGRKQAEYIMKAFEIDIAKQNAAYQEEYAIRTDLNKEKEVSENRCEFLNLPEYDKKLVESLKKGIENTNEVINVSFRNSETLKSEKLTIVNEIRTNLEVEKQKLHSELSSLQEKRETFNISISNQESTLRALQSAENEIKRQAELIKKYIPEFEMELKNFDLKNFRQGQKAPITGKEINAFTPEMIENLPEIIKGNLNNRKSKISDYSKILEKLKSENFSNTQIKEIDNKLSKLQIEFSKFTNENEKFKAELIEAEKFKPEYVLYVSDQQKKVIFENAKKAWQKQDKKVLEKLQIIIDILNDYQFADKNLKLKGFINENGHLDIVVKYFDVEKNAFIDFTANSSGEQAKISALIQASLVKKGELALIHVAAQLMSKEQTDEIAKDLINRGMQVYFEFTEWKNDIELSISHYLGFAPEKEKTEDF